MRILAAALTLVLAGAASGQGVPKGAFPGGFEVRSDGPGPASEVVFVTMRPGWHITTGPASVLYDAALTADGSFRADAEIFLFDPGTSLEGFGVFVGGRELSGEATWTAFLIRQNGEFRIERRASGQTTALQDWTAHPAILRYADRGEGITARNELAIDVSAAEVMFQVNGTEVARLPRERVAPDGTAGLRVYDGLNLHVSSLVVTKR